MHINFSEIKAYDRSQQNGFEELICQIARRCVPCLESTFERIEGAGGDGGVEAIWILPNGNKHGFQAKYHLATKEIDWNKIDGSVKTALEQHPELTKYYIAIACDLTGKSGAKGRGKSGWEHWNTHRDKWVKWATDEGRNIDFIPWGKSELADIIIKSADRLGLMNYWFGANSIDNAKCQNICQTAFSDLGDRFQPADHVTTKNEKYFDGLQRSDEFYKEIEIIAEKIPDPNELVLEAQKNSFELPSAFGKDLASFQDFARNYKLEGASEFPLAKWRGFLETYRKHVRQIRQATEDIPETTRKALSNEFFTHIYEHEDYLYDLPPIHPETGYLQNSFLKADHTRLCVVIGPAGSGKSHLLANAMQKHIDSGGIGVLTLGQYFSGDTINTDFLTAIDQSSSSFDELLSELSIAAECSGKRCLIAIDAINEAQNLHIWPDQLAGFVRKVLSHKWLSLAISLRPEYEDILLPKPVQENATLIRSLEITSADELEAAAKIYLDKRGIARPTVPWLAPEFSNFLFLKTCCDALQELGKSSFPKGLTESLKVFEYYLRSAHSKIQKYSPNAQFTHEKLTAAIGCISSKMASNKCDFIDAKTAKALCADAIGSDGPDAKHSWFDLFVGEGIFRRDHNFDDNNDADPFAILTEIYRFTYQRFSDHLLAKSYLKDVTDPEQAFSKSGTLSHLIEPDSNLQNISLWTALSIQIPEKFPDTEMFDIFPNRKGDKQIEGPLLSAFVESLQWRSETAFSDKTLEIFNSLTIRNGDARLPTLFKLASTPNHPWNADFLHTSLVKRPLAERDAFWSVPVNSITKDDSHPIWGLINWCLVADLKYSDYETLRLTARAICWLFSSSSRPIRDSATRSLTKIFICQPSLVDEILSDFINVDDPYIIERICAAILGAVTKMDDAGNIRSTGEAVWKHVFSDQVPLDISTRDYARAAIQFVQNSPDTELVIDIEKVTPPYGASWAAKEISSVVLEQMAEKCGDNRILLSASGFGDFARYVVESKFRHFTSVRLSQPKPLNKGEAKTQFKENAAEWSEDIQLAFLQYLSSEIELEASKKNVLNTERIVGFKVVYSKEKKEALKIAKDKLKALLNSDQMKLFDDMVGVENRSYEDRKFDAEFAKRWVAWRAYDLGWTTELFPNDQSGMTSGRQEARVERIGKKYQWIALRELLAMVSDNFWSVKNDYPLTAELYDHPANDWFVRDIEPSILERKRVDNLEAGWQLPPRLSIEDIPYDDLPNWPFEAKNPVSTERLIATDQHGEEWLSLYTFDHFHVNHSKNVQSTLSYKNDFFVRQSCIVVNKKDRKKAWDQLQGNRLADPSGHETQNWTDGAFLLEYPWRNTWDNQYGLFEESERNLGNFSYFRPVAKHVWESQLECYLENGSSVLLLNPWIARHSNLAIDKTQQGALIDKESGEVVFRDLTSISNSHSQCFVQKKFWLRFLNENKFDCIWMIAGERSSYPSGKRGDYSRRSFAGTFRLNKLGFDEAVWQVDEGPHAKELDICFKK